MSFKQLSHVQLPLSVEDVQTGLHHASQQCYVAAYMYMTIVLTVCIMIRWHVCSAVCSGCDYVQWRHCSSLITDRRMSLFILFIRLLHGLLRRVWPCNFEVGGSVLL